MTSLKFEITGDDELTKLARELNDFIPKKLYRRIARTVIPQVERNLQRTVDTRLRKYPRPAVHPFVWSNDPIKNERGRRGFFARYPNGYTRTGQLGRDWYENVTFDKGAVTVAIGNDNPAASYVYGSLDYPAQVPGHATTGWLFAPLLVSDIVVDAAIELEAGIELAIDEELKKL